MLQKLVASIICLLIMALAVPSQAKIAPEKSQPDNFALVERLFNYSGAELKEIKLKQWGQISYNGETLPELEKKYLILAPSLGLDPEKKTVQIDRDGFTSLSQLEILSGDTIQIFLQAIPGPNNHSTIAWGVSIQTTNKGQAREYYERMQDAFKELDYKEEPGVEFCGIITRYLADEERTLYLQPLVDLSGARYIEGINSENLSSLSLFSQDGAGAIAVQGQKINLNLALRSNPLEDKTTLHIGMPLILNDY